jgi:diguanylate cyclase (GGDEF)-like protein
MGVALSYGSPEDLHAASSGKYRKKQGLAGIKAVSAVCISLALIVALGLTGLFSAQATPLTGPGKKSLGRLPTITTARAVHSLTSEEAARAYPVHLRAVVTYFNPDLGNGFAAIFVCDGSCVWVNLATGTGKSLTAGTLVDVTGVSGNGLFAPVVASPHLRVIGLSHLPEHPLRVNHIDLFSGVYDSQWVEVEGTVQSFSWKGLTVTLHLVMPDGPVNVLMPLVADANYSNLVDARVSVRGNVAPVFSRVKYQMVGSRLMAPALAVVKVLEAAPSDSFNLPAAPVDSLMRWDHISILKHRVHLLGTVTLFWPGSSLCIRDDSGTICTQTEQQTPLAVGQSADLVGFATIRGDAHILTDAVYRPAGTGRPVAPTPINADDILHGLHDSELISIDGQLINLDIASSDTTLTLSTGKIVFAAVLPNRLMGAAADRWRIGSKLRITGICSVSLNADSSAVGQGTSEDEEVAKSFRVLMRSPGDVVVLQKASWWTPAHAIVLLAVVLTGALFVLAWVAVLRRHVEQQASLLRASEERFRHMAMHDALTGLATRLLLRDRMSIAIEAARRHQTGLALLMIDLDRFKEINDTFGHPAGDQVLRVTANRLQEAVRRSDTVARIGGDEFVAFFAELSDPQFAACIAMKMVKNLSVPITFENHEIPVSVSIGVCSASGEELDADTMLRNADKALYCTKAQGRNGYTAFTPESASAQIGVQVGQLSPGAVASAVGNS